MRSIATSPPGPTATSAAQGLQWISRPYDYLRECAAEFGDVFALDFGTQGRYVVFSHPEALRAIFTAQANLLHVGPGNALLEPLVGSASLLLLEEGAHMRERRLLLPAFQPRTVTGYGAVIQNAARSATAEWGPGTDFEAQSVLQEISIDVILKVLFGLNPSGACSELRSALVTLLNDRRLNMGLLRRLSDPLPDPVLESFQSQLTSLRTVTREIIAERRASPANEGGGDVLSILLSATDEKSHGLSDDEVRDELLTLVVTGHETTATALAWGLFWIATHEPVRLRLQKELRGAGKELDLGELSRLEYLDATCKEVLRIHPIVPSVFREVVQPFSAGGYAFDPGVVLSPSIYLTHNRPELYPDGIRFDPDRFLRRTYSPYEYLPFGGGVRRCIGMHLATYEMKIILASLIGRYELELVPGQHVVAVRRMVAIAPSGGPRLRVKSVIA